MDPKIVELIVAHQKIYDEAMKNNDAVALATKMFTDDAVLVTETGPIYGRMAIEKYLSDLFQKVHFTFQDDFGHTKHVKVQTARVLVHEGDTWKIRENTYDQIDPYKTK